MARISFTYKGAQISAERTDDRTDAWTVHGTFQDGTTATAWYNNFDIMRRLHSDDESDMEFILRDIYNRLLAMQTMKEDRQMEREYRQKRFGF